MAAGQGVPGCRSEDVGRLIVAAERAQVIWDTAAADMEGISGAARRVLHSHWADLGDGTSAHPATTTAVDLRAVAHPASPHRSLFLHALALPANRSVYQRVYERFPITQSGVYDVVLASCTDAPVTFRAWPAALLRLAGRGVSGGDGRLGCGVSRAHPPVASGAVRRHRAILLRYAGIVLQLRSILLGEPRRPATLLPAERRGGAGRSAGHDETHPHQGAGAGGEHGLASGDAVAAASEADSTGLVRRRLLHRHAGARVAGDRGASGRGAPVGGLDGHPAGVGFGGGVLRVDICRDAQQHRLSGQPATHREAAHVHPFRGVADRRGRVERWFDRNWRRFWLLGGFPTLGAGAFYDGWYFVLLLGIAAIWRPAHATLTYHYMPEAEDAETVTQVAVQAERDTVKSAPGRRADPAKRKLQARFDLGDDADDADGDEERAEMLAKRD
eukprot:ctg_1101.g367